MDGIFTPPFHNCKDFESFLWCLGSPINLETHKGFNGNISFSACPVTPYFADLTSEVVFKCPYLFKKDSNLQTHTKTSSKYNVDDGKLKRFKSMSSDVIFSGYASSLAVDYEEDTVGIVWIEDIQTMNSVGVQLPLNMQAMLLVHPLKNSPGLFWVRTVSKSDVGEAISCAGPLSGSLILSGNNLGTLARNTIVNMQRTISSTSPTFKKPSLARKLLITDISSKHIRNSDIFYADLFSQ